MIVMKHFLNAWKNYSVSDGRSTRAEFWSFYGITIGVMVIQMIIAGALFANRMDTLAALVLLSLLVHIAPYFSLFVRRLHDIGLSSWYSLLIVVPFFLQLILQIMNMSIHVGFFGQSVVYTGDVTIPAVLMTISFVATLVFGLMDSKPGVNQYGPNPKEVARAKKMQESVMNGQQFQNGAHGQFYNMGQQQFQNGVPQQFSHMGQQQFQNGMQQQFNHTGQQVSNDVQVQSEMSQPFNVMEQSQVNQVEAQQFVSDEQQFQGVAQGQFENQHMHEEVTVQENVVHANAEELSRFEKLFEEGALTQEEFELIKNRLSSN